MSTDIQFNEAAGSEITSEDYRALSVAAMTSLFLALLSIFSLLSIYLWVIPIVGVFVGIYALIQISRRSTELVGKGFAITGIVLSSLLLVTSISYSAYVYATEVPEGYRRIYYSQLQPEEGKVEQKVPPLAEQLDGQQVFIKGYIFPGKQRQGIKTFLLVRDRGDCCFGGNPKLTDRIQVNLADSERLKFSSRLHKLAGTFRLSKDPGTAVDANGAVYYYLDDGHLR